MKPRKGLTLIEMMIAISLSSLIFLIVSALMMTVINSNSKSKTKESFEQVKNDLHAEFTNRIRWGEVVEYSPHSITVDGIVYTYSGEKILRDGQEITPDNLKITAFDVKDLSTTSLYKSLEIKVGLQSGNSVIINDSLRLVISQRQTSLSN